MKFLVDTGYIIKRVNIGEADRFITVFTRNFGKQELIAKGVRKIHSKRGSHLELLNKVKFNSVKTQKNYVLTEVDVVNTFADMKEDKKRIGSLFLICELIDSLCAYNQKNEEVFDLLTQTLQKFDKGYSPEILPIFQADLLTYLGFWDKSRKFASATDMEQFIESITERKLKSKTFFYTS